MSAELPEAPGFYWILIAFDPDARAEWVNKEQPGYWDGNLWHLLGSEGDWSVRWVGEKFGEPAPERGEVDALIERLREVARSTVQRLSLSSFPAVPIKDTTAWQAAETIASLSAEVERLRKD